MPLSAKGVSGTLMTPVMTRASLLVSLLAAAAALLAPGVASAGITSAATRAVDLAGPRAVDVRAPAPFDLVGVRWRGTGRVQLRTRAVDGAWSAWRDGAPEEDDRPDAASAEAGPGRGWVIGSPWWVGRSDRLQVRALGPVSAARATFVASPEVRVPLRALSVATAPAIVPRVAWGADETIRRGEPTYATQIRYAVVHHTAGSNDYSRAEAAAIVRGIEFFHVRSNGWNDIGYNFLVDRFGTVYEGRYGGIDQNVVGAHAQGFNTGSVGVAVLGTYAGAPPSAAAEKAVAALLAWRLDLAHVDPLATLTVPSGGNERFPAGVPVRLLAVSGHRDTGFTVCPGDTLYARLGALAAATAATGGPKLYDPVVSEQPGGLVRFQARLSQPLPWTVVITGPGGGEVARGSGSSADVDWTWDASTAPAGEYRWTIGAGTGARAVLPATGTVGASGATVPLEFQGASADPETITPNGDGQADTTTVTYALSTPAAVTVSVVDEAGAELALLEHARWRRAGEHTLTFDGVGLDDGRYAIRLLARSVDGSETEARVPIVITRTLGRATVAPAVLSPFGENTAGATVAVAPIGSR